MMSHPQQNINNNLVAPYNIEECKRRISDLPEKGFSRLKTITEIPPGDTYSYPFRLIRVSRNMPIKWLALCLLEGNFDYESPEITRVSYHTRVNWQFYVIPIVFLAFFLIFAMGEFGLILIGIMGTFSLVQVAINIWIAQRFLKKQLKQALQ